MTTNRKQRMVRILEVITTRPIHTQDELVQALAGEGYRLTQSSVSRDIATLGLVKQDGIYHRPPPSEVRTNDPNELRIREGVLAVAPAGEVLVVIHTPPGEANRVGIAIDRLAWSEVVGTVAGDDTIFLAARDRRGQRRALTRLRDLAALVE